MFERGIGEYKDSEAALKLEKSRKHYRRMASSGEDGGPTPKSLAEIYAAHRHDLLKFVRGKVGKGPPEPDDIVQQAFANFAGLDDRKSVANPIGFLMSTARYPRSFSSLVFTGPPFHICPIHGVWHGLPASSQGLNHQRFARPFDVETKQSRSYSNATIYPTRPSLAKHPYFPKFASGGDSLAGELLNDQDLNVQRDMVAPDR